MARSSRIRKGVSERNRAAPRGPDRLRFASVGGVVVAIAAVSIGWLFADRIRRSRTTQDGPSEPSRPRAGSDTLRRNAEKALRMKQAAGPSANIPEHRTAHQGGVQGPQVGHTDTVLGREATYTSNLKRSHNARTGDA